jgi:hypothetical protein
MNKDAFMRSSSTAKCTSGRTLLGSRRLGEVRAIVLRPGRPAAPADSMVRAYTRPPPPLNTPLPSREPAPLLNTSPSREHVPSLEHAPLP